jgi:starch phosphorylase
MKYAEDPAFQKKWLAIKLANKKRLAKWVKQNLGVTLNPAALFDIQVKRIHEYKRQLLNIIGYYLQQAIRTNLDISVMYRYRCIKGMTDEERADCVPRVVMIGGKAAPGYHTAKLIIKLVSTVAEVINNDTEIGDLLKVLFLPNYNVSLAEIIIPASDISQHISTAGLEASGTRYAAILHLYFGAYTAFSNMKFALNGGLILGTMDGANVEICEEIGAENMFIFGALAHEVAAIRKQVQYVINTKFKVN